MELLSQLCIKRSCKQSALNSLYLNNRNGSLYIFYSINNNKIYWWRYQIYKSDECVNDKILEVGRCQFGKNENIDKSSYLS